MAHLARIEHSTPRVAPISRPIVGTTPVSATPDFSPLEWSIIRLAQVDGLWTIRPPGPLRRFYNWLIGQTGSPQLANERLEVLRRIAVLSWHFGFTIPGEDVADFLSAGFTPEQYELLVTQVRAAASQRPNRTLEVLD
jgi:hypothetical protein